MRATTRTRVFWALGLSAVLVLGSMFGISRLRANDLAAAAVPTLINYQGYLRDSSGNAYSGQAALRFAIYDAELGGNNLWSETQTGVAVSGGNFAVKLGAITPLSASLFGGATRYLQVGVDLSNSGSNFTDFPRQQLAAVPYAFQADSVPWSGVTGIPAGFADGVDDAGSASYANVVVVAKSGGNFTSINQAMSSINPSSTSRYLIWVAPGLYEEQVVVKPYVHLQGAGAASTRILAAVSGNQNNSTSAAVVLPANSQISALSVENSGTLQDGVAIYVNGGNDDTLIRNVEAATVGSGGDRHVAIYLNGGTARLEQVAATASGGSIGNWAIFNSAASPTIDSATLLASGGSSANAIRLNGGSPVVQNATLRADQSAAAYAVEGTGAGTHTVRFDNSALFGEDFAVRLSSGNYNAYVGASLVDGGGNAFSGVIRCVASYKADYTAANATCN